MDRRDWELMGIALACAEEAGRKGEVPVGAVVVDPYGRVLAQACNGVEAYVSQTEHAEARAIRQAGAQWHDGWRLEGCTLYVTLEPCLMCRGLIALSRLERLVYGAPSPLYGYTRYEAGLSSAYSAHLRCVEVGLRVDESVALLQQSFHDVRRKKWGDISD